MVYYVNPYKYNYNPEMKDVTFFKRDMKVKVDSEYNGIGSLELYVFSGISTNLDILSYGSRSLSILITTFIVFASVAFLVASSAASSALTSRALFQSHLKFTISITSLCSLLEKQSFKKSFSLQ